MKSQQELIRLLTESIGHFVRLVNNADVDMDATKIRIHVHGKLFMPEDDGEWCVVINETVSGTSVIGFDISYVEDVFTQPSGTIEITLR